ncbi:hypothetical protein I4U23_003708, partial [Adineta vaga]
MNNAQFHLYQTKFAETDGDYDCLDHYAAHMFSSILYGNINRQEHYIIPYCRRDQLHDEFTAEQDQIQSFTFETLKERNVSSDQLYQWSAPLDLVEEYEAFVLNNETRSSLIRFYNCSLSRRFGQYCQYFFKGR